MFLVVLFLGIYTFLHLFTRHGKGLLVPDFSGLSMEEARKTARPLHLRLEVTDSLYMPELPAGVIFRQVPPPGQHVKKNRRIELTVNSLLPRQVSVPSLVGFSLRQAKAELASHGLK
ncbi:MAG: PASTA domain-containing protein, partial [Burkholderiales bacterium]|nr:PASTA domain-containing protein [Burkholderiales bacterium]